LFREKKQDAGQLLANAEKSLISWAWGLKRNKNSGLWSAVRQGRVLPPGASPRQILPVGGYRGTRCSVSPRSASGDRPQKKGHRRTVARVKGGNALVVFNMVGLSVLQCKI
jgi:hypothetical protein